MLNVLFAAELLSFALNLPVSVVCCFNISRIKGDYATAEDMIWLIFYLFFVIAPYQALRLGHFDNNGPASGLLAAQRLCTMSACSSMSAVRSGGPISSVRHRFRETNGAERIQVLIVVTSISRAGAGVAQSARLLARAVTGQPVDLEVVTLDDPYYKEDVRDWGAVTVRAFPVIGPAKYGFSPGLLRAVLRSNADVMHVHGIWMFHCLAVHLWAWRRRKPYVVTPHGMLEAWIRRRSPVLKALVSVLYQNRFLRNAALFHLLTEKERVDVADFASESRIRIVSNCVEPFEAPHHQPPWWDDAFAGRDVYLFFGRIHDKKGCLELCAAWDRLCTDDPAFRDRSVLVFCGWVDGLQGFDSRVAELQARHGNAVFAGPQYGEDKQRSIAAASFFLLPSKSEGLPMSVLEAWAAGKPVLMTPACNLSVGFATGAAIEIGTEKAAIEAGLVTASRLGAAQRADMGRAARALVDERYSVSAVGAGLMALYRDALKAIA